MKTLLLSCLCFSCCASDRSDQLPDFNKDRLSTINTININHKLLLTSKRHSHPVQAGPKHPAVEAAHAASRRKQEDEKYINCCCFLKLRRIPLH